MLTDIRHDVHCNDVAMTLHDVASLFVDMRSNDSVMCKLLVCYTVNACFLTTVKKVMELPGHESPLSAVDGKLK